MDNFPKEIHIKNKLNFVNYNFNYILKNLRKNIYKHILKYTYNLDNISDTDNITFESENNSYDLDDFFKKNKVKDEDIKNKLFTIIKKELKELGWNCQRTFRNTTLFIYSSNKTPKSCWKDEF